MQTEVVITSAKRTPIGHFQGSLKDCTAPFLGGVAIKGAIEAAHLSEVMPEAVIMGCVLSAGLGQAPARQAALQAGLNQAVDCTTINKMCASGMKAIMQGFDRIQTNPEAIIVAGGMESMTLAPYLLPKARRGYRFGHQTVIDHMLYDGLEDAYETGKVMGVFAERCASALQFTRDMQDAFAIESVERSRHATDKNIFKEEISPITLPDGTLITKDDGPGRVNLEKISQLKPAFDPDGTVTAANSSSIADGAAAVTLMSAKLAKKQGLRPIAKIITYTTHAQEPALFTTAPIFAIQKLLTKLNWQVDDVDLWEINEAFAVVVLAAMQKLNIPHDRLNIHGGACVLGHPIGASGARLVVTLLNALKQTKSKRGIAALCIGGGEATALAVEMI